MKYADKFIFSAMACLFLIILFSACSPVPDSDRSAVDPSWQNWIQIHANPIRSLDSPDFSDLSFLDPLVSGKSIIQLGEVAHGVAEQNRLRVRIIKYLHQRHGFNVLAFESGYWECGQMNRKWHSLAARDLLKNSLYTFWHTDDLLDLFTYIKASRDSANPIDLAGFDIQHTGFYYPYRPAYLRDIVFHFDRAFAEEVYQTDQALLAISRDQHRQYVTAHYTELNVLYSELHDRILKNKDLLIDRIGSVGYREAERNAYCRKLYIQFKNGNPAESVVGRTNLRDHAMGEMARFLKDRCYPDRKMILWAHNFHTYKRAGEIRKSTYEPFNSPVLMGNILDYYYGAQFYAIGMLAYRGRIYYGEVIDIHITGSNFVESILNTAGHPYLFIDMAGQVESNGNNWMFSEMRQKYLHSIDGAYDIIYRPRQQLDAYIFIRNVSRPNYLD